MLPVPREVLKRLRLDDALALEAASRQSLLPRPPGWERVHANSTDFTRWLEGQLRAGLTSAPQVVVAARKEQHGVRPVPVWGFAERVTYRALVDFVLRNEPALDQSPEAYLSFIGGPVQYARDLEPPSPFAKVGSSVIHYVVKSDINAFYEYVDHGILSRELLTRTSDYAAIECLMSMLSEVQGRVHGLPQLLDPSDRLSEVYIDLVERAVLRRGWPTWRFNDDFRIAVRDFTAALAAIEDLSAAAWDVGLTLSDVKTTTPRFSTYTMDNFGLEVDDELPMELSPHEPEDFVGDYTEGVGEENPSWAVDVVMSANSPETPAEQRSGTGIDLGRVHRDDFRRLRRALARLVRASTPAALDQVTKLVVYTPSLTPWVMRYISAAGAQQPDVAAAVLAGVIAQVSLSDWQRIWVVRTLSELGLLEPHASGDSSTLAVWVSNILDGSSHPVVAAEATLALASVGEVNFDHGERRLRSEPSVLGPWYLSAIDGLQTHGRISPQQYAAVREEGGLYAAMLDPAS